MAIQRSSVARSPILCCRYGFPCACYGCKKLIIGPPEESGWRGFQGFICPCGCCFARLRCRSSCTHQSGSRNRLGLTIGGSGLPALIFSPLLAGDIPMTKRNPGLRRQGDPQKTRRRRDRQLASDGGQVPGAARRRAQSARDRRGGGRPAPDVRRLTGDHRYRGAS